MLQANGTGDLKADLQGSFSETRIRLNCKVVASTKSTVFMYISIAGGARALTFY